MHDLNLSLEKFVACNNVCNT